MICKLAPEGIARAAKPNIERILPVVVLMAMSLL
jgi:hypothetical protein